MNHTYPLSMPHDPTAAESLRSQLDAIVRGAVLSIADCLRAPCVRTAVVETDADRLAVRTAPAPDAPCTGYVPDGALLTVCGRCGGWYAVRFDETQGFVSGDSIVLNY